jgi:hypothetical protein
MFVPRNRQWVACFSLAGLFLSSGILAPAELPKPEPHRWELAEFGGVLSVGLEGHRSFKAGKALFTSAKCADCHRFANLGKEDGLDLTRPAQLYTPEELLAPILSAPAHFKNKSAPTDTLTQEQILDLLAFLFSGGDPTSSLFLGAR